MTEIIIDNYVLVNGKKMSIADYAISDYLSYLRLAKTFLPVLCVFQDFVMLFRTDLTFLLIFIQYEIFNISKNS